MQQNPQNFKPALALFRIFYFFRKPDETWFDGGNLRIFEYVTEPLVYRPDDVLKDDKRYFVERYFYRIKNYKIVDFLSKYEFKINGHRVYFKHFQ